MRSGAQAVLLTGLFGDGKSTLAADLADVLEAAGVTYATLELDWLTWTNANGSTRADEHCMMLVNLKAVDQLPRRWCDVLRPCSLSSGSSRVDQPCGRHRDASAKPVELELPYEEIARRIIADPTDGRRVDLARTASWMTQQAGSGLKDVTVTNDRSVRSSHSRSSTGWTGWTGCHAFD